MSPSNATRSRPQKVRLGKILLFLWLFALAQGAQAVAAPRESAFKYDEVVSGSLQEYWDQDSQLLYLRARWYDPRIGRFISADPFEGRQEDPRSLNRYVYAHSDPVHSADPSGRMSMTEIVVGLKMLAIPVVTTAAPMIYLAHRVATNLNVAMLANHIKTAGAGLTRFVGLNQPLRLIAGNAFEKIWLDGAMRLLGGVPQVRVFGGSIADWVFRGKYIVDAKLGQYISVTQARNFVAQAALRDGSVTYVTLTSPAATLVAELQAIGAAHGVTVRIISFF